jgi:hypothetical protein
MREQFADFRAVLGGERRDFVEIYYVHRFSIFLTAKHPKYNLVAGRRCCAADLGRPAGLPCQISKTFRRAKNF